MTVPKHWKGASLDWQKAGPCCTAKHLLDIGWWWNWLSNEPASENDYKCPKCGNFYTSYKSPCFVPMSWGGTTTYVVQVAQNSTGRYYMILCEPDNAYQSNKSPCCAATAYFDCYNAIKAQDASAKIGGIGLIFIDGNDYATQWAKDNEDED